MVIRVAVASSCVNPLYCTKYEQLRKTWFPFKKSIFISPTIKTGEPYNFEISFSNNSSSFDVEECLKDGEMYMQTTTKHCLFLFVAFLIL